MDRTGKDMSEFFAMGGYGFYVWGAYGVAALAVAIELVALHARRRAAEAAHAQASLR
jgi:heme exporter protein D